MGSRLGGRRGCEVEGWAFWVDLVDLIDGVGIKSSKGSSFGSWMALYKRVI